MDTDFESAVDSSTQAGYSGSGCSVELFKDGTYRVLWNNSIGNLYDSEGTILGVPKLSEEDDSDNENEKIYYGNAEEKMKECFLQRLKDLEEGCSSF